MRPLVLNSDFDLARGSAVLALGEAEAIAFGRAFLANPDLPKRLAKGAALNVDNGESWYSQGVEGYLDYPGLPFSSA